MFKRLLTLSFLLVSWMAWSQESIEKEPWESLLDSIPRETIETLLTSPPKDVRKLIYLTKDPKLAFTFNKVLLKRAIDEEDHQSIAFSSYRIGNEYLNRSAYTKAVHYAQMSAASATVLKDSMSIVSGLLLEGTAFFYQGKYEQALQQYLAGKEIADLKGASSYSQNCNLNIGLVRIRLKRYKDALSVFDQIIKEASSTDFEDQRSREINLASMLLFRGVCLEELNRLNEAIENNDQGIAITEKYGLDLKGEFYINYGKILYKKKEYHKATGYLDEGKAILSKTYNTNFTNILIANFFKAKCLSAQQKDEKALQLLLNNLEKIEKDQRKGNLIEEMYELAIELAKKKEDKDLAIRLGNEYRDLLGTAYEDKIQTRDLLWENDKRSLENDKELLLKQKNKEATTKNILMAISIFLAMILLFGVLGYKRRMRLNEERFVQLSNRIKARNEINPEKKEADKDLVQDEHAVIILDKLKELEASNFFLSSECNLYNTAKAIETNTSYLSKTLNKYKNQPFTEYLNEIRINYALKRLHSDSKFRNYTIKAISEELGYKSVNTFNKVFKHKTNLNPSYYLQQLEKNVGIR